MDLRLRLPDDLHADLKAKARDLNIPASTLALLLVKLGIDQRVEVNLTKKRAS